MYDIIGDIHGHAFTLENLLRKLHYNNKNGYYESRSRKVIFTGDFIDRGSNNFKTLEIVKNMIDNGSAFSVMGKHEYNIIGYFLKDENQKYLYKRTLNRKRTCHNTLQEFYQNYKLALFYIDWFRTLPIFIETQEIRIVHACWNYFYIDYVKQNLAEAKINWNFLIKSFKANSIEKQTIDILLKGPEIDLPENIRYTDKDGLSRKTLRIKWWKKFDTETYQTISINDTSQLANYKVEDYKIKDIVPYSSADKPVFVGHYWRSGRPTIFTNNVCSVDYSVAKRNILAAYRWDGEQTLSNDKFVWTPCID